LSAGLSALWFCNLFVEEVIDAVLAHAAGIRQFAGLGRVQDLVVLTDSKTMPVFGLFRIER
jgi:hypothetical protein